MHHSSRRRAATAPRSFRSSATTKDLSKGGPSISLLVRKGALPEGTEVSVAVLGLGARVFVVPSGGLKGEEVVQPVSFVRRVWYREDAGVHRFRLVSVGLQDLRRERVLLRRHLERCFLGRARLVARRHLAQQLEVARVSRLLTF